MKNKWEEKENISQKKIENKQIEKNPEDSMKEIRIELMELLKKGIEEIKTKKHNQKSGIYMIHNVINNKIYIGSATDLIKRRDSHLSYLRNNKHSCEHLQRAWNKYGKENFKIYVLEIFENRNILCEREQYYLDILLFASENDDRFEQFGYNKARNAERPNLGRKMSDEQKKKISEKNSGVGNGMYGKQVSDEFRKKVSDNHARYWLGKKLSKVHIENRQKNRKPMIGSKNVSSKLNEEQVIEIRKRYIEENITMKELGNYYGISPTNVNDILKRKIWKHI